MWFDRPDSLWSDSAEHSLQVLVEGDAGSRTVLAVGPRAEFRRTRGVIDRPYDQWGLAGSVTFTLGSTLWLQFTDEVGTRHHSGGDDLLYTDFVFNWSMLYLTWQPLPRLGMDLFCAVNPELHDDKMDDTTTLLCTHDMAEAETLADRVGILDGGRLLALEEARALKRRYRADTLEDAFLAATGREFVDEEEEAA